MNIPQFLAFTVINSLLKGGSTLRWKTIQAWINENGNPNNIGRGYASFNPRTGTTTGNSYVELRKEPMGDKRCKVTASVYFNKRQGAFASKTWEASKIDSELQKMFGKNLRTRIQI